MRTIAHQYGFLIKKRLFFVCLYIAVSVVFSSEKRSRDACSGAVKSIYLCLKGIILRRAKVGRVFVFEIPFLDSFYLTQYELIFWGSLVVLLLFLLVKSAFVRVQGGREGLVGQKVHVLEDFELSDGAYQGQVLCMGEIWSAKTDKALKKGEHSSVASSEGLVLVLSDKE